MKNNILNTGSSSIVPQLAFLPWTSVLITINSEKCVEEATVTSGISPANRWLQGLRLDEMALQMIEEKGKVHVLPLCEKIKRRREK